jgi:hypothetical protein
MNVSLRCDLYRYRSKNSEYILEEETYPDGIRPFEPAKVAIVLYVVSSSHQQQGRRRTRRLGRVAALEDRATINDKYIQKPRLNERLKKRHKQ